MDTLLMKLFPAPPPTKIGFEDMVIAISHPEQYLVINTLPAHDQLCLIQNTLPIESEESRINELMNTDIDARIVIYGRNATDDTPTSKYAQLYSLGFKRVYVYSGGLFEWLLLQDIYGKSVFPTDGIAGDVVKYRGVPRFSS